MPVVDLANGLLVLLIGPKAFVEAALKGFEAESGAVGAKGLLEGAANGLEAMGAGADEKTFCCGGFDELLKRLVAGAFGWLKL